MTVMIQLSSVCLMVTLMGCAVREGPPSPSPIRGSSPRSVSPSTVGGERPLSPSARAAEDTAREPQQRVSSQDPPLPEPQKFAIPEGITTNTEVLPIGFVGADPQSTVEWFKKSLSQIPIKIDQYSTATERTQFDQLRAQQFDSLGLFPFVIPESSYKCQKKYDPGAQLFSSDFSVS